MERMGDEQDPAAAMFTGPLRVDLPLLAIFLVPANRRQIAVTTCKVSVLTTLAKSVKSDEKRGKIIGVDGGNPG
jgi:hypothetical protein